MSSFLDNTTKAQRSRLLDALHIAPITTLEARRHLDILMPAARVFELRQAGFDIATIFVWQDAELGKPHQVAKYVLQHG